MSAEVWAWLTLGVFGFWFVMAFWSGFYHGIAASWADNLLLALLSALIRTAQTAVVIAAGAALAVGVKELWLS